MDRSGAIRGQESDGFGDLEWFELEQHRAAVVAALRSHRTQLTVDDDGAGLVHSGGQRQDVHLAIGLREVVA